jgi:hypothetical protein
VLNEAHEQYYLSFLAADFVAFPLYTQRLPEYSTALFAVSRKSKASILDDRQGLRYIERKSVWTRRKVQEIWVNVTYRKIPIFSSGFKAYIDDEEMASY